MDLYLERKRQVGKAGLLAGQRCSSTLSNGRGLDIRQTRLGDDGGVWGKEAQSTNLLGIQ